MGVKINYGKNINDKFKIIGIVSLILLCVIILIINFKSQDSSPRKENNIPIKSKLSDGYTPYNNLEELLKNYGSQLISNSETENLLYIKANLKYKLYTEEKSNENYFVRLCNSIAIFSNFRNIELVDEEKNIKIEITCDGSRIVELKINGDINYYLNHNSEKNKGLSTNVTDFTIQSPELQKLIDENWNELNVNFGTKESTCNGYNIYFDEGIRCKTVARNIYNVIFTTKYTGQVAGSLSPNSTPEQVENSLGKPTFSKNKTLYGYLGKSNYLFFDFMDQEISVYPVIKVTKEEENKLKEFIEEMNESSDIKTFASKLTDFWIDYDIYDFDSYYVDLRYTLKGISLSIDSRSLKNGIYVYQNYSGNRNIADLDNVYIKDTDFVFEQECERSNNELLNRLDQGNFTEEERKEMGVKFAVRSKSISESGNLIGVYLYSRDKEFPDTELERNLEISSWKWYDEYNFIYSVDNDGIYVYNCLTRINTKLESIKDEIYINKIEDDKIIFNENNEIQLINN